MTPRPRPLLAALALACAACGGGAAGGPGPAAPGDDVVVAKGRPPLAAIVREGDPVAVLGIAVTTEGAALRAETGAEMPVALAALVEGRLRGDHGDDGTSATPSWGGLTAHLLLPGVHDERAATAALDRVRRALLAPVTAAELPAVQRKLDALARRPLPDRALLPLARCRGEPFGAPRTAGSAVSPLALTELETWRARAVTLGRTSLSVVGNASTARAFASAIAHGPTWPEGSLAIPALDAGWPDAPIVVDGTPELGTGEASATLAFVTERARSAVGAASGLADPHGPLASRLSGLEGAPRLVDIAATAHPRGGCLTVKLAFTGLGGDASGRIATALALARQEVSAELADAGNSAGDRDAGLALARRAGDPRDAAERAAFWSLVAKEPASSRAPFARAATAVAVGRGRDAPSSGGKSPPDPLASLTATLGPSLDRALAASKEPAVESRVNVERGQAELWLALASPCGTLSESDLDAGLSGAVAFVATATANGRDGVAVEPLVANDAIGVVAHAPLGPAEPPSALAHRVADAGARSFAADPLDPSVAGRVRADLLARGRDPSQRGLITAAAAALPGHTSWWVPLGSGEAFGRATDAGLDARAAALRAGPLRVAVLANVDATQGAEAARAADRWVARHAGEPRACPAVSTPPAPRPGTYAVESAGHAAEAWIALPLPPGDDAARRAADLLAAMLDGAGGLLAKTIEAPGLAKGSQARLLGPVRAPSLVVHLTSAEGALDAAVAQTRALFDRVRQGALADADRQRAIDATTRAELRASLDPRARLLSLLRGRAKSEAPPSLADVRAFAANHLRDESLVIVAVRAPRGAP